MTRRFDDTIGSVRSDERASYQVLDATPSRPAPAPVGDLLGLTLGAGLIVFLGVVALALGSGSPPSDAVRIGAIVAAVAMIALTLLAVLTYLGVVGNLIDHLLLAGLERRRIDADRAVRMAEIKARLIADRERAAAQKIVSLAEIEHTGRLREEHMRQFLLTAGKATEIVPIEDPMRALVQTLLLDAYKPTSQDPDGSGRLVQGVISRERIMAAGYTKAQYEEAKRQLETAGVLTFGPDRRWRLDRLRYPSPQDAYRAVFGSEW